jgi:predicted nucleic acid-binding protein
MAESYLLDTTVLLHWTRGDHQAKSIDEQFHLTESPLRPLVCEVSLGEMLAFSRSLKWGPAKQRRLAEVEQWAVVIDISDSRVREAYADLSTLARSSGWALFHGKNDLWVGAAAHVARAHLLTMDVDFMPLVGRSDWRVTVLDPRTATPLPSGAS